jgi:hypothetical protein
MKKSEDIDTPIIQLFLAIMRNSLVYKKEEIK